MKPGVGEARSGEVVAAGRRFKAKHYVHSLARMAHGIPAALAFGLSAPDLGLARPRKSQQPPPLAQAASKCRRQDASQPADLPPKTRSAAR